jgi:hypothetical protein
MLAHIPHHHPQEHRPHNYHPLAVVQELEQEPEQAGHRVQAMSVQQDKYTHTP